MIGKSLITSHNLIMSIGSKPKDFYLFVLSETNVMLQTMSPLKLTFLNESWNFKVETNFQIRPVGDLVSETHSAGPQRLHYVVLRNSSTFDRGAEGWWTGMNMEDSAVQVKCQRCPLTLQLSSQLQFTFYSSRIINHHDEKAI